MFGEGAKVEVLVKIKHDQDVWYPATIVENCKNSSFLVEYMVSVEPRKVRVDCSRIRPTPPSLKGRVFELVEKVDAFNEFGWWDGVIAKALPDNRYSVFFKSSIVEFDQKDVRPQLNWKDGKWWFASSQEEVPTPCQENTGGHVVSELNEISSERICESKITSNVEKMEKKSPVSACQRESNPRKKLSNDPCTPKGVLIGANVEKSKFRSSSLAKDQTDLADLGHHKSHGVASSPKKVKRSSEITTHLEEKFKRRRGAVTPSCISSRQNAATSDKQNGGIDSTSDCLPSNTTGENMVIGLTGGDQPSDYPSLRMRTPKQPKKMDGKDIHTLHYRRKPRQAGEECIKGFTKLAKPVERDSGVKKDDVIFRSLERCNLSGSEAKKPRLRVKESLELAGDQKKQLNDLPVPDQPEAIKSRNMKKSGKPRKVYKHRIHPKVAEQVRKTANHDTIIKDRTIKEVDSHVAPDSMLEIMEGLSPAENILMPIGDQLNHGNDLVSSVRISSLRMPIESSEQALITKHELQMPKEAKHRITSRNKVVKIPDSSDGTVSKTSEPLCIIKEVNRTVQQKPGGLDDQPLPMSFEKMHSPGNVKSSTPGASTEGQLIELRQTRKELNGETASGKDNENAAAMNEQVHAQNHVCVDNDTMVEHSAKLRQTRKELNSSVYDKNAADVSEEVNAQSRALVDGNTSVTTTGELRQTRKELNEQTPSAEDNENAADMSEEVNAQSHALVDGNTSITTTGELRHTRKELNEQTPSAEDNENAADMSEEVNAQSRALVDGNTSITTTGELRQTRKELNEQTPSAENNKHAADMSEVVNAQSPALVDGNTSITTTDEPALPFVKSSTLWTAIESMEALRKFPQKPHYKPLQQYKESQRELFAIASMVHFEDAVEKISKLRFDSATKQKIDDILDTLNYLEEHGFGVQALRDTLAELESTKEQHKKHLEEVDVINKHIVSCNFDKAEQDEEINEVTKQMQELQERIATAESMKKMDDDKIAVLESRVGEAEEAIKGLAVSYVSEL